jgi:hypothetical protein
MSNIKKQTIWKTTIYIVNEKGKLVCTSIKKQGLTIEQALFSEYLNK